MPAASGASPVLTMIFGTVVGVAQTNVKRMLAYSSIAHAGYLLVGLVAANDVGKARGAVLSAGLRGDQPRRVRRAGPPRPARSNEHDERARLRRAVAHASRCWRRC